MVLTIYLDARTGSMVDYVLSRLVLAAHAIVVSQFACGASYEGRHAEWAAYSLRLSRWDEDYAKLDPNGGH